MFNYPFIRAVGVSSAKMRAGSKNASGLSVFSWFFIKCSWFGGTNFWHSMQNLLWGEAHPVKKASRIPARAIQEESLFIAIIAPPSWLM